MKKSGKALGKVGTFKEIGKALGKVVNMDLNGARMKVSINADESLQFERKVGFPNGDVGMISLVYEGLYRYCFKCKRVSHKESSCPLLTEDQKKFFKSTR
ncbi:unnamed protein product, partial [Thlaspi arvense]